MIIVIIAGGSGTRLWPLSTPEYPKHLLKVDGTDISLLQATYGRTANLSKQVYVVSDASHIEHVRAQLPDVAADRFIIEPGRRGTANCIIAALSRVGNDQDADEPVAFFHADHYIRDTAGFSHSLRLAAAAAKAERRIVLVGVEPVYPATNFGYIEKGDLFDEKLLAYNVRSFKEKPAFDLAKSYLKSGNYLWNCGYFVGSISTFTEKMRAYAPELLANYKQLTSAGQDEYESVYLGLENSAIDYALIEKVKDLLVVPAEFDWMDVGSFDDLHKAIGGDQQGNSVQGKVETESVTNSFVQNTEDKPMVIIGLNDVVVVNTPKGILVARKDLVKKVGEVSKRLNA